MFRCLHKHGLTLACALTFTLAGPPNSPAAGAGTVVSWGNVFSPPPATTSNSVVSVAGGQASVALRTDGTVVGWDWPIEYAPPPGLTNIIAIGSGRYHALAVRQGGQVVAWGYNGEGQTNVPALPLPGIAVDGGDFHSIVLTSNATFHGAVYAWGVGEAATVPSGLYSFPVSAIAAGALHNLALYKVPGFPNGRVAAWGNSAYQQLNIPPSLANGAVNVQAVAAGDFHSLALVNGTVYGWGCNNCAAANPPPLNNAIAIAADGNDSMALLADGRIVTWGASTTGVHTTPPLTNVTAIAMGDPNGSALRYAILVQPLVITTPITNQTTVVGQTVSMTVLATGALPFTYQWKHNVTNLITGATGPTLTLPNIQLSGAGRYTVTITSGNELSTNVSAELTVESPPLIVTHPTDATVNAGQGAGFQVAVQGSVPFGFQWRKNGTSLPGINAKNQFFIINSTSPGDAGGYDVVVTNRVGSVTSLVATLTVNIPPTITDHPDTLLVLAGSSATFSVTATGATTYQWQKDGFLIPGATNRIFNINSVQPSDAGQYRATVANQFGSVVSSQAGLVVQELPDSGTTNVVAWGEIFVFSLDLMDYVDTSPPGGLGDITALAAGLAHTLALRSDGTVVGWGDNTRTQSSPPGGLNTAIQIAAGDYHSLALTASGTVLAWGDNGNQQATPPAGLSGVGDIAAGARHSLALRNTGLVVGFGDGTAGQATPPPTATGIAAIAAGGYFSLGLKTNGTVVGWGANDEGQRHIPAGLSGVTAIAAGTAHGMALKNNGTVVAWGRNNHGQTNVPPGLASVQAIAAGGNHCLALLQNGTVVAWGQNNEGQIQTPSQLSALLIAAGGTRSIALVRNRFVLDLPQRLPNNGGWRLRIRHTNGSPVLEEERTTIEVRVTDNLSLPPETWPTLQSPLILLNGVIIVDDPSLVLDPSAQRYYTVIDNG